MSDPLIRRFDEFVKTLNRSDNFTLAQKRVLRDLVAATLLTFIQNTGGTPTAELYGTSLRYGNVIWRTGLTFDVTPLGYYIDGNFYTHSGSEFTLSAADATNPRIDLVVADTSGNVSILEGTPAAEPVKPTVSEETGQIEISFITVSANATEPDGVTAGIDIYTENAGGPAEWDTQGFLVGSPSLTLGATTDPFSGTTHIAFTNSLAGTGIRFTSSETADNLLAGTTDNVAFRFKFINVGRRGRITLQGYDANNAPTGPQIRLEDGTYGIDFGNSTSYQTIAVPMSDLNAYGASEVARIDLFRS